MLVYIAYILVCFAVACFGINKKFGFWGYFFASLLFTPFIGLILVIASDSKPTGDDVRA